MEMQTEIFNNEIDLTPEDYDILMYLLDETSISIDDGNDNAIMNDMARLRMRGFDLLQSCAIMDSTNNNPVGYSM